jgi:Flp pilus assembly protein TadB
MSHARFFLAVLGFLLAVGGVALDNRPLVWTATAVLACALALRLWARRQLDRRRENGG